MLELTSGPPMRAPIRALAMPRVLASAAVAAAALVAPGPASAAELHVDGPARCVDRDEIVFRLEQSLHKPLAEAVPLTVGVRVRHEGATVSGRVDVSDGAARRAAAGATATPRAPDPAARGASTRARQRLIRSASCEELTDSLTVVIALALHSAEDGAPHARAAPAASAVSAPREAAAPPEGSAVAAADPGAIDDASGRDARASVTGGVLAGVVGDAGSLPQPALGVVVGVELGTERWRLRALGTLLPDQLHRMGSAASAPGAELGLATGALLACALSVSWLPPLEVRGCAGWEFGQLSGVGTGVPEPRHGSKLWSAPLLDAGADWRVSGTSLRIGATLDLAAPLGRDEFVLEGLGRVHRPSSIVGRLMLAAGLMLD